jgi:hypothetical protein
MTTDNKRVSAYLPASLCQKFEEFKSQHNLGDSQALVTILSQFLGVTHSVAQSSSDLDKRINQLKIELKSELLSELKSELLLRNKDNSKPLSNILSESQAVKLALSEPKSEPNGNIPSESLSVHPIGTKLNSQSLKEYLNVNLDTKNVTRDITRAAAKLGQQWEVIGNGIWKRVQ